MKLPETPNRPGAPKHVALEPEDISRVVEASGDLCEKVHITGRGTTYVQVGDGALLRVAMYVITPEEIELKLGDCQ